MFWEKLDASARQLRRAAGESRLLAVGIGKEDPARDPGVSFYRRAMRLSETAFFPGLLRTVRRCLHALPLRSVGCFFAVWAVVCAAVGFVRTGTASDSAVWFPILFGAMMLPLVAEHRTVGELLVGEGWIGRFLIGYCRLPGESAEGRGIYPARLSSVLFAGIFCGAFSAFWNPVWILIGAFLFLLLALGIAVPELPILAILLLFPFLARTEHPSVWLSVLAAVSVVCFLWKAACGRRPLEIRMADLAALLFAAVCAAGGMVGAVGMNPSGFLYAFLLLTAWIPARVLLSSPLWRGRALGAFLLSGGICSGIGIVQYLTGKATVGWLDLSRFGTLGGRVCATFSNPNLLAIYLIAVWAIALGQVLAGRRIAALPGLLSGVCLILTWSRGAWLGALAATAFLLALHSCRSLSCLLISPLFFLASLPWIPQTVRARLSSIRFSGDSSVIYRISTYRGSLRLIRARPFGIGSGEAAFHRIFPDFAVSGTESVMHAHNLFLQVAIEHGIPGLLIFLAVLIALFRGFFRTVRTKSEEAGDAPGIAAALIGLLVMGCFDHLWYQPMLFWMFWFFAAMLAASVRSGEQIAEDDSIAEETEGEFG